MKFFKLFGIFLIASVTNFYSVECCDGYKLKVLSVKNCGKSNQVIKITENATLKLNKDCEIIPNNSCVESMAFKSALVTYQITKNGIPVLNGKDDLCARMDGAKTEVKDILQAFGLPTKCPVEKTSLCATADNRVNIKKHKSFLGMAMGKIGIHAEIEHDTGKSCFDTELSVKK